MDCITWSLAWKHECLIWNIKVSSCCVVSVYFLSEGFQTPVHTALPQHYADVWDQGHSLLTCLPLSVFIIVGLWYITQSPPWLASSMLRLKPKIWLWPNCLRTSNPETDLEICVLWSPEDLPSQIWFSHHNWAHLTAPPQNRGGYTQVQPKLMGYIYLRLIWVSQEKKFRSLGVSLLLLAFVFISCLSFGDSVKVLWCTIRQAGKWQADGGGGSVQTGEWWSQPHERRWKTTTLSLSTASDLL